MLYLSLALIFRSVPLNSCLPSKATSNVCDTVLISSNLPNKRDSTYALRRHLINILSEVDCLNFGFYGRGWRLADCTSNFRSFSKYSFSNITHDVKLTARSMEVYGGTLQDKTILTQCKSSISIENYISPSGYSTEKLLEPLIYGSIPLYIGPHDFSGIRDILPSSLLRLLNNKDAADVVRSCLSVSEMSLSEAKDLAFLLRDVVNKYVESNSFPTALWKASQNIIEILA